MTMARQIKTLEPFTQDVVDGFYSPSQDENWVPVGEGRIENLQDITTKLKKDQVLSDDDFNSLSNLIPPDSKFSGIVPITPDAFLEINQQNVVRYKGGMLSLKTGRFIINRNVRVEYNSLTDRNLGNYTTSGNHNTLNNLPPELIEHANGDVGMLEYLGLESFLKGGEVFTDIADSLNLEFEGTTGDNAILMRLVGESIPDRIFKSLIPLEPNAVVRISRQGLVYVTGRVGVFGQRGLVTDESGAVRCIKADNWTHYRLLRFGNETFTDRKATTNVSDEFISKIKSNGKLRESLSSLFNLTDFNASRKVSNFNHDQEYYDSALASYVIYGFKQDTVDELFESNMRLDRLNLTPITTNSLVKVNVAKSTVEVIGDVCDYRFRKVKPGVYPFRFFNIAKTLEHKSEIIEDKYYRFSFHYSEDGTLIRIPQIICCRYAMGLTPPSYDINNNTIHIYPYDCDREIWDNFTLVPSSDVYEFADVRTWSDYYEAYNSRSEIGVVNEDFIYTKDVTTALNTYSNEANGYYSRCFPLTFTWRGCRTYPTVVDQKYVIDWRKWIMKLNDNDNNLIKRFPELFELDCTLTSIPSFYRHLVSRPNPRTHVQFQSIEATRENFPMLPPCTRDAIRSINNFRYLMTAQDVVRTIPPNRRFGLWTQPYSDSSIPQRQIDGKTYVWVGPGDFVLYLGDNNLVPGTLDFYTYDLNTNLTNAFSKVEMGIDGRILRRSNVGWTVPEEDWLKSFFKVELEHGYGTYFKQPPTTIASWCIRFAGYVKSDNAISALPYLPVACRFARRFSSERYAILDQTFREDPKNYSFRDKTAFILSSTSTTNQNYVLNCGYGRLPYRFTDKLRLYEGHVFDETKLANILEEFQAWDTRRIEIAPSSSTNADEPRLFNANYLYFRKEVFDNNKYGLCVISGSSSYISETIHGRRNNEQGFSLTGEVNNPYVVWTGDERTSYVEYPSNVVKYLYRETDKGSYGTNIASTDKAENTNVVMKPWHSDRTFYAIFDRKGRIVKNKSTLYDIRTGNPQAFEPMTTVVRSAFHGTQTSAINNTLNTMKPIDDSEMSLLVANCFTVPRQGQNPDASKTDSGVPVNFIHRNYVNYQDLEYFVLGLAKKDNEYRPSLYFNELTPEAYMTANNRDFNDHVTSIIDVSATNSKFLNAGGELYLIGHIRDDNNDVLYCVPRMSLAGWTTPMYYMTKSWLGLPPDAYHDGHNGLVTTGTWLYNPHLTAVDGKLSKFLKAIHGNYYERSKTNVSLVRDDFDYGTDQQLSQINHPFNSQDEFRRAIELYRRIFAEGDYNKLERFALAYGKMSMMKELSNSVPI